MVIKGLNSSKAQKSLAGAKVEHDEPASPTFAESGGAPAEPPPPPGKDGQGRRVVSPDKKPVQLHVRKHRRKPAKKAGKAAKAKKAKATKIMARKRKAKKGKGKPPMPY